MARVDLNCDLGEGAGHDAEIMPLVTSANIACGAHAGDAATMRVTVELAQKHGVAIGAHPGLADREHFGRRELPIAPAEIAPLVLPQIRFLREIAAGAGAAVRHVKLHGALYNLVARDRALATALVDALSVEAEPPALFVLAGSELERVARARGSLRVFSEVFADRTYRADGSLTPRSQADALIVDETAAVAQVRRMILEGKVRSVEGADVAIRAETLCLHGDGPHVVAFGRRLGRELAAAGVDVRAALS